MNHVLNKRQLLISTLSPIHMGTDEDYQPTNYVIDDDALYEFDTLTIMKCLPKKEVNELNTIVMGKSDDNTLREIQNFFYKNKEHLLPMAINTVQVSRGVQQIYKSRIGKPANLEQGGKKVMNKLEVQRCAYHPYTYEPILTGSGIKGAIRTALLDQYNNDSTLPDKYKDKKANDGSGIGKNASRKIQQKIFQYVDRNKEEQLHKDPMRLVFTGDASAESPSATEVCFAVNRKKYPVKVNGQLAQSQAENKGLYQLLECISALQLRAFKGELTLQETTSVGVNDKLPEFKFSFSDIASACNRFYQPILEEELAILKHQGFIDYEWQEALKKILAGNTDQSIAENKAFLLRVGRHSGAESVTLNGLRSIKIMKDDPLFQANSKTLWLAANENHDRKKLLPFGWLLIEMIEGSNDLPQWPEVEMAAASLAKPRNEWLAKVSKRQDELNIKLQQRLKQQNIDEAEKEKIEQEAKQAQQREQQNKIELQEMRKQTMPADQAWLANTKENENWLQENNRLLDGLERFFQEFDNITEQAKKDLVNLLEDKWPGITKNPEATQGRNNKPKYKKRPKSIVEKMNMNS